LIPKKVRIASYVMVIATFVVMVELLMKAYFFSISEKLGIFIPLIVVNCIILGRAEAFASKNSIGRSFLDALGMGIGFTFALFCLGAVREILGNGTFFGLGLLPGAFQEWIVMILPAGGFFTLAGWLLLFNHLKQRRERKRSLTEEAA